MEQVKWFDRNFNFTSEQNIFPSIIDRLEGTIVRLKYRVKNASTEILKNKPNGRWSVLENIGHLSDLEPLWQTRLQEILNDKEIMAAADLTNTKTNQAAHNKKSLDDLVSKFVFLRNETLIQLQELAEKDIYKSSLHPRLKTPMRIMDLFLFVAEHDDHHLVSIRELIKI
ncbi:MAG: DinB family protein [Ginsengibacter sp.]